MLTKPSEVNKTINEELIQRIKYCESGGVEHAKNAHSTAKGYFQFLDSTWRHYGKKLWGSDFDSKNPLNGKDNEELARWVIDKYGTSPWNESKGCWE